MPAGDPAPAPLVVVDATAYLFRSFHAIRDLRTRDGQPTNAVYGIATTLAQLRDTRPAATIACVMDAPGTTFRHDLYPAYKATRKETDKELKAQIEPAKRLITALGMPLYCVSGVEADDVIATLALRGVAAGREVAVATSDKDLMFLAGRGCRILDPMKGAELGPKDVQSRYGVPPARMLDYLSLVGDTSDNVPGVPGVGAKTAAKWLNEYGDLDTLVERRDEIKGKVGESLRASLETLELARTLIRLREDVDVEEVATEPPAPVTELLDKLCAEMRFGDTLKTRLARVAPPAVQATTVKAETVTSAAGLAALGKALAKARTLGMHFETAGADAPTEHLVGFAVYGGKRNCYVPVRHAGDLAAPNSPEDEAHALLAQLLGDAKRTVHTFGVKEIRHALLNAGIDVQARLADTGLLAFCVGDGGIAVPAVARRVLDYQVPDRATLIGGRDKPKSFDQLPVEEATAPACQWAQVAHDAHPVLADKADKHNASLHAQVEEPAIEPLLTMERNGICLDTKLLDELTDEFNGRMVKLQEKVDAEAGYEVNINSPAQLSKLLFEEKRLATGHKTRKGALSTSESELERLARNSKSPLPQLILDFRHAAKLVGTYTAPLPRSINPVTGRVHTRFIQTGAVTGRLASKDPNLQNIPIRTADGRRIRQAFVAAPGHVLLSADYSQIELRILAHLSEDRTLLDSFAANEDVHRRTAAELYGLAPDEVNDDQRRFAKTINFGLIYGMGAFGLAQRLTIPQQEAKQIIATYFERLPGVRAYLDRVKDQAAQTKQVTTMFGRRIGLAARGGGPAAVSNAMRAAINAPMQGGAADIMKLAMTAVHHALAERCPQAKMLLQVHDELVLEVPEADTDTVAGWLPEVMGGVAELKVPLTVDVGCGGNWEEAH